MKWSDMLPLVSPYVAGCSDQLAITHLVQAARRLCDRSLVWNYEASPITSTAGLGTYTIQIREGQELVRVITCEVAESDYTVVSGIDGRMAQRRNVGRTCYVEGSNDIKLIPTPWQDGLEIITDIAVRPSLLSPDMWPDDLKEHVEIVAAGAISSLCAMPASSGATWHDAATAQYHEGKFTNRAATLALRVSKGFGRQRSWSRFM